MISYNNITSDKIRLVNGKSSIEVSFEVAYFLEQGEVLKLPREGIDNVPEFKEFILNK